ncbi:hypothetical protein V8E51_019383, partial [Hyaloscypha variabilis]
SVDTFSTCSVSLSVCLSHSHFAFYYSRIESLLVNLRTSFNQSLTFTSLIHESRLSIREPQPPRPASSPRSRSADKMGANLSSSVITHVDTSADVISPQDAFNTRNMALLWLGSFQGIMMILSTTLLVDRWRGPQGTSKVGFVSVLAALLLSAAWPVVFLYMMMAG